MPFVSRALLMALVLTVPAAAQRVFVVAPALGPGVDFTIVQSAIDAASTGDTILVRAGSYDPFVVDGKGLVVVGEGRVDVVGIQQRRGIDIRNVTANQSVVVRGFWVSGLGTLLRVDRCAGAVTVEDVRVDGVQDERLGTVTQSQQVTWTRCVLVSGTTGLFPVSSAVLITDAKLFLFDSECRFRSIPQFGAGGAGIVVTRGDLYASSSTFAGSQGAPAQLIGSQCFQPPGDGGPAIELTDATSRAQLLDCVLIPGAAGSFAVACPPANPGAPVAGLGSAQFLTGFENALTTTSPMRGGQTANFTFQGVPGNTAVLLLSPLAAPTLLPPCHGAMFTDLSALVVVTIGVVPPSGTLRIGVPVPTSFGAPCVTLFTQVVGIAPSGCLWGTASAITLLASQS